MAQSSAVQKNYNVRQFKGYPGTLARPMVVQEYETGKVNLHAANNADDRNRALRPGDLVYWDAAQKAFSLARTAANAQAVIGMVIVDDATLGKDGNPIGAAGNSDVKVEFGDDSIIKVATFGIFFGIAGEALVFGDQVRFDTSVAGAKIDSKLVKVAAADINKYYNPLVVVEESVADGELVEVRFAGLLRGSNAG